MTTTWNLTRESSRMVNRMATRSAYHMYGRPGNSGETFRGITFFPKRPKFSVPFVCITSVRLHFQRKRKLYRYFVNGTTQSHSCFRCPKNYQYLWRKFSTEISVQMVRAPGLLERKKTTRRSLFFRLNFNVYSDVDNRERARARNKKKQRKRIFVGRKAWKFFAAVRKWEMLEATKVGCSLAKQRQRNVQKSVLHVQSCFFAN